jgi:hypothetical protein
MLSTAYSLATWAEWVAAVIAVLAVAAITWRLVRKPRRPVLGAVVVLVLAAGISFGSHVLLGTRVEQISLNSIRAIGLEKGHAGLRSNALIYDTQVSLSVRLHVLPSGAPISRFANDVSGILVHKTTTVRAEVATYGLIDFTTLSSRVATVNRQAKTISLSLPNPEVGPNTTYVSKVGSVALREGPLTDIGGAITGFFSSLDGHPVLAASPAPELARAESRAVAKARGSAQLASCAKQEIAAQLASILHLTPAYRGYTVRVAWQTPPQPGVNCAALQQELVRNGG